MVKSVILASPRGFCAGVVRAIDIVELALDIYGPPVYVRKEIVHNQYVVRDLRRKGAIFVQELDEVPPGRRVIFSAHGVSPQVWSQAKERSLKVIDAACPLVTKVHLEVRKFTAKGHTILLIGHKGHEEVEGTMGESPSQMKLITSVDDAESIEVDDPTKLAYLTQTTLSLDDTAEIIRALKKRFPLIQGPPSADICYATQNRQEAVREMAGRCDLILVIGAENSSNSNRLVEEARRHNVNSFLIADVSAIDEKWLNDVETVGITSGASAPERLVEQVVDFFASYGATIEEFVIRQENVHFALPTILKEDLLTTSLS